MAGSPPPALLADDLTKDVQMTSPGTASIPVPGSGSGLASLGQVIDSQIEQLGKLKTMAISEEQNWRDRETLLREKIRELEQKLARRDEEIGRLKQASSTSGTQELLQERCAELETRCTELQHQLDVGKRESNDTIVPTLSLTECNPQPGYSSQSSDGSSTGHPLSSEEDDVFTNDHREYLVREIDLATCKKLLRTLKVHGPDIENNWQVHAHISPYECSVQGIQIWQQAEGRKATVWTMVRALVKCKNRHVAETFCDSFSYHTLLSKLDADIRSERSSTSLSSMQSFSRETSGEDAVDTGDPLNSPLTPPNSPPACPSNATPLHMVLWPYLRDRNNSFRDLNHELEELAEPFSQDQLNKFIKRLEMSTEERETFKASSGDDKRPASILGAWAEIELSRLKDEMEVPRLSLRNLGKILRKLNKMDVRKVLLQFLHCGVLGPHFDEKLDLRDPIVSYNAFQRIATQFSAVPQGKDNWKNFASKVGYSKYIHRFESGGKLPGESVLETWKTGKDATIGVLYDWAVESDRSDVVEVLEEDLSKH